MQIAIVLAGIVALVALIVYFRLNTFISFVLVALGLGIAFGLPVEEASKAIQKGIGSTLGFLVIILGFGAMLGKLVADSGAAQRIADTLISIFPNRYVQYAVVLTGFIVGVPMFYSVGFVILLPLVFSVASRTKLPLVFIGLPMLSALSVTHGYLPPHPAPTALVESYSADIGLTILYGFIVAIPAIILGGPVFASTLKGYNPVPLKSLFSGKRFTEEEMPGLTTSVLTALLPVILLAGSAICKMALPADSPVMPFMDFIGDPIIAMIITILVAIYTLGIARGKNMGEVSVSLMDAIKDISMILLIIAGAGALKEILIVSKVSDYIGQLLQGLSISPLILAWGIASVIRFCVGSATVAGLTSAGIVAPLIPLTGADPNLMVLATGAGSLMFSHVNDTGFWLFKEYFNMSVKDTLKTWSVMEMIVSVAGIIGVLILNQFI